MTRTEKLLEEILAAVRELTVAVEQANPVQTGGAARGSEPIGTGFAIERIEDTKDIPNRSFVRSTSSNSERTNERRFSWEGISGSVIDADCGAVLLACRRISKVVQAKPGSSWRADRRLIVTAAALAGRIDTATGGDLGTRWLNQALESVTECGPRNTAAYFQTVLKQGLADIDPVLHDKATAQMLWLQLTRAVDVPEKWLIPPARQTDGESEVA